MKLVDAHGFHSNFVNVLGGLSTYYLRFLAIVKVCSRKDALTPNSMKINFEPLPMQ